MIFWYYDMNRVLGWTHSLNSEYLKQIYLLALKINWHVATIKDFTGKNIKSGSERWIWRNPSTLGFFFSSQVVFMPLNTEGKHRKGWRRREQRETKGIAMGNISMWHQMKPSWAKLCECLHSQQSPRAGWELHQEQLGALPLPNPPKSKPKTGIFFTQYYHNRCKLKTRGRHCFPAGIPVQGGIQGALEQESRARSRAKAGSAIPSLSQPGLTPPARARTTKILDHSHHQQTPPAIPKVFSKLFAIKWTFPSYLLSPFHPNIQFSFIKHTTWSQIS